MLRQRRGAGCADARRKLDDVVGLEALDDPVVANVDDLDVPLSAQSDAMSAVAASL